MELFVHFLLIMSTPFVFPKFYSLPPFFTRQPVERTFHKQLHLWKDLLLSYTQYHRMYTVNIKDGIFYNEKINRGLQPSFIKEIFLELVSEGKAEWMDGSLESGTSSSKQQQQNERGIRVADDIRIYWNNKDEWATILWNWVIETGREGTVCTLYELREGETAEGTPFQGMDLQMMKEVLKVLEKRGKCVRMGEEGVKFSREI